MAGYKWNGGPLDGKTISARGCVAFAFILSDAAFGSLPARMYAGDGFKYENIKAGDILRVNNDTHTVIVLEVSDTGVVVAEGNISTGVNKGKVHWGRTISRAEVMGNTSHYITRYSEGYVASDDPEANVSIVNGTLEGGLTWSLTKAGTLAISGKGAMPDFDSAAGQPWGSNSSRVRKVVIGDGVTSIGSTIPSSVKTIGDSAFRECQNLSSVTFSEGLETIVQNAFRSCTSLTSIALLASLGEIGTGAFFECTNMKSATFTPGSRQVKLGDNIFIRCYYMLSVTLPKDIDCISEGMFQNCQMLAGIEIPQGAKSIGNNAFSSCSSLTVVIIPDSVTTIGIAAFASCSLTDIYFTGTQAQWNSISKIGDTASALSKVTMHYEYKPNTDKGDDDDNSNGDNSRSSGNSGGSDDSGSGDNPEGADNPGGNDNPGVGDNSRGNDNPEGGDDSGNDENQTLEQTPFAKGKTFTVGKITYKVTKVGKEVELIKSKSTTAKVAINTVTGTDGVKYKVTAIGSKAMQKNKKLIRLTIGANVKTIGANAFSGCTKLTTVTFGKNVSLIGTSAFKGCTALKKPLSLPDSVKTIGANAFSGCSKITAVTIGKTPKSNLKTIGKNAFYGCKKIGKVTIRSTKLTSAGKLAFKGTKSSLKMKVPFKQLTKYKKILKKAGLKVRQITK